MVRHRFGEFLPPGVRWIFMGTFNPEASCNPAHFYYSRPQNHFWRLLPEVFGMPSLKNASYKEKIAFSRHKKVGFIDLIRSVEVPIGSECTYEDAFIDNKVAEWNDVFSLLSNIKTVEQVLFTRKSFKDIPNIRKRIEEVHSFCVQSDIKFSLLPTPARIYSDKKLNIWQKNILM
ncbi:hypothetical protein [Thermaurantimonas aggregans]|uniref:hypothetical protein n=1 Tax=Thermaurantimonas aggregans TaxID=2173829 RepID=UPI001C3FA3AF|nr:hypothetical protein [Thermaurantimonas aggregans]